MGVQMLRCIRTLFVEHPRIQRACSIWFLSIRGLTSVGVYLSRMYWFCIKLYASKNYEGYIYQNMEVMMSNYLNFIKQQNANIITYVQISYSVIWMLKLDRVAPLVTVSPPCKFHPFVHPLQSHNFWTNHKIKEKKSFWLRLLCRGKQFAKVKDVQLKPFWLESIYKL